MTVIMNKIPLTVTGAAKMRAELQELKAVQRPAIINAIAEARSHGDLSENAEYAAAKERQSFIEGRIAELEAKLSNAQIINPALLDELAKRLLAAGAQRLALVGGLAVHLENWLAKETHDHLVRPAGDALEGALQLARSAAQSLAA